MDELLTDDEKEALDLTGRLVGLLGRIIAAGGEDSGYGDTTEVVFAIHILQRYVMSQAAARAYPQDYRLLGGRITRDGS